MGIDPGMLAGLMGGAGAGGPAGPAGPPSGGPPGPMPDNSGPDGPPSDGPITMYTSAAIQALHDAIAHEQDPEDKATLAQCLQQVLKVQAKNAAQAKSNGGPGSPVASRVAGGGY